MNDKYCVNCLTPLSINNCYLDRGYLRRLCRSCDNKQRLLRARPKQLTSRLNYQRQWAINNRDKQREYEARRKSLMLARSSSKISYQFIYKRDLGICHICLNHVDFNKCHFDHVIPLSKNGDHSYENIKVSCAKCNLIKNDRLIGEY